MNPRRVGPAEPQPSDRGLSPVVGKTLELGVGVLFVALLTATFFGGVAPDYRASVGTELGDRTLVAAAERTEAAVPPDDAVRIDRRAGLRLPETIHGDPYRVVAGQVDGVPVLTLRHPDERIGGRLRLSLPDRTVVSGAATSASPSWIRVVGSEERGIRVTLGDGATAAGER
ncbi:DUF7266 family protein [Halobellus rarus]|uniref:Uncharacterized protein n=1 Tax=Halobellus rarus TaxID=1126237 RepID=A0ABD6CHT3_9EURY|nr:hypothetical protein [Halobellus rarus]